LALVALHGGGASKVSGIYEDIWTLYCMLELLAGRASAIKLEPPGSAGHGFEFFLRRTDGEEWHQVKYQHSKGKWTLAELDDKDVLSRFKAKLEGDRKASCRFISSNSTYPLGKLCAHASKARTLRSFKRTYLSSNELEAGFADLRDKYWKVPERTLWDWLRRRVYVRLVDDEFLEQILEERLATYVTGAPNDALQALDRVKEAILYEQLTAEELKQQLTDHGCPPRAPLDPAQGSVRDLVRQASQTLAEELNGLLIQDTFLAREAVQKTRSILGARRPPETLLLTGKPGCGKSSVLGQLITWALTSEWTVLSLDVSGLTREQDTDAVGRHLGLPTPPARALTLAAAGGRGLLIIDALDSVSFNHDNSARLFPVVDRVLKEARAHPELTVVISCRSEDLAADERLRDLVHGDASLEVIDVPPLGLNQTKGSLVQAGFQLAEINQEQLELVRLPALLKMLIDSRDAGPCGFSTPEELRDRYLDFQTRSAP
jgi:hypothetical protein